MIKRLVSRTNRTALFMVAALGAWSLSAAADAQTVFSSAGVDSAAITSTVDAFRGTLGNLNPNSAGSFTSGRREINWDGVPDAFAAPNLLPGNFFNANSPRGVVLATPGSGFAVSANVTNPSGTATRFGNIDPSFSAFFEPFSAQRLFTAIGSNIVDVSFFVPGGSQSALTRGFGVVFSDVDLADTTSLSFFDQSNGLLGTYFATPSGGQKGFSFVGVDFGTSSVARVRITSGNQILATGNTGGDLVVMDDFIYGEPLLVAVVPEPGTYALMLVGLGAVMAVRRRRAGHA